MAVILLIDDDAEFGELLREKMEGLGHVVQYLDSAEEGLNVLTAGASFDIVLLDNKMPGMSGLEFLSALREREIDLPVILMTSVHKDQTVIEAANLRAVYVLKPLSFEAILEEFEPEIRAALSVRTSSRPISLPPSGRKRGEESALVGTSKPMIKVLTQIGQWASKDLPVLILGETGTGKELVAHAIHTYSPRKHKPFVPVNCGAITETLVESKLFGHVKHAFTGAEKDKKGVFEEADGGTLFLDEIGDMPLTLQVKLLRVLENQEVTRIGSNEPIKVDVRVISATHRDLKEAVREGRFRQDLYYRLEGKIIPLPPLRERKEDIPLLAECFLSRIWGEEPGPSLHPAALEKLMNYSWPGNIRQLHFTLCRAVGMVRGMQIMPEDLEFGESDSEVSLPAAAGDEVATNVGLRALVAQAWASGQEKLWPMLQEKLERELLRFALSQPGISQVQLARRLGIARNTLRARIEEYGLQLPEEE